SSTLHLFFFPLVLLLPPRSPLFPYTTLFRSAPIYISEIAPPAYRGRLGMMQQLAIVVGILLAFISNYFIANADFAFLTTANHWRDRKSTRLNSSHVSISYAVFCLKKKN